MANEALKNAVASYGAPRSICQCTHSGDGPHSDHTIALTEGHGACTFPGCKCQHFKWDGWTRSFQAYIEHQGA